MTLAIYARAAKRTGMTYGRFVAIGGRLTDADVSPTIAIPDKGAGKMATFVLADDATQAELAASGATSEIDLTPYKDSIRAAFAAKRFGVMTLGKDDNPKAERKRIARAARALGTAALPQSVVNGDKTVHYDAYPHGLKVVVHKTSTDARILFKVVAKAAPKVKADAPAATQKKAA